MFNPPCEGFKLLKEHMGGGGEGAGFSLQEPRNHNRKATVYCLSVKSDKDWAGPVSVGTAM